jgi:uncharacterized RDD family membrane protein YckC
MNSTNDYFVVEQGQKIGPLDLSVLETMRRDGTLSETTLMWRDGMADWQPARTVVPQIFSSGVATPEPPVSLHLAGRGQRVLAGIIDFLVVIVPMNLLIGPSAIVTAGVTLLGNLAYPVANAIYVALLLSSRWQATLGMKLLGLKVVDYSGQKPSSDRCWGRGLSSILSWFPLFGIGYLMVFFTPRHQTLHDMMAGTLVVKE